MKIIIDSLFKLLDKIKEDKINSNEQKNLALNKLVTALNETKIYLKQTKSRGQRNESKEEELCRLWATVAVPLRLIDKELAEKCLSKSDYWLNPQNYWRILLKTVQFES